MDQDDPKTSGIAAPSGRRRQLHILYLLNDLFHHTKYHIESPLTFSTLTDHLQSFLEDLLGAASAYNLEIYVNQHKCIADLLNIWERKGYLQSSYIRKLKDTASNASKAGYNDRDNDAIVSEEVFSEERKDAPYILPSSHGDPSTPFYDLPAANMMPHIMPNSVKAINPKFVKALQFAAGPADEHLVVAVKEFLENVDLLDVHGFGDREDGIDIDELGQTVLGDEAAEDGLEGEGYYGWSREFCKQIKNRGVEVGAVGKILDRAGGDERSLSPRKRRHYSGSGSSRSPGWTIGRSRSSSLSDQGPKPRNDQQSSSRSSRSRNTSREQRQYRSLRSRSRSRSPSYSPPQTIPAFQRPPQQANVHLMQQVQGQGPSIPLSMPFPRPLSNGFPLGPGRVPKPPPPPPNYHGPWPPPPPPMPNTNGRNAAPAQTLPTGPRTGQSHVAGAFERLSNSGFQNQTSHHFEGWTPQQLDHISTYPYGDRSGAQQLFEGSAQNSRGRGYGRGGWN